MNNIDDEATKLQNNNEETQLNDNINPSNDNLENKAKESGDSGITKKTHGKNFRKAGGFAAAGVLLGAASSVFKNANGGARINFPEIPQGEHSEDEQEQVVLTDSDADAVAMVSDEVVNDDMTFNEAFSAARTTFGPGAAFEWKGNVYATYTKEEWDGMSDEEKTDFLEDLNMSAPLSDSHAESNGTDTFEDSGIETQTSESPHSESSDTSLTENEDSSNAINTQNQDSAEGATIIIGEEEELEEEEVMIEYEPYEDDGLDVVQIGDPSSDDEIQIIGVGHNPDSGMNIAAMQIDGQDAFVVDVDGDMVFDQIVVDLNNDGVISEDEVIDIQEFGITVDDMGGSSAPYGDDMMASNDEGPDYMSDISTDC